MKSKPAIIVLSVAGIQTAAKIKALLPNAEIHARQGRAQGDVEFDQTATHIRALFDAGRTIIGLCAAGILVRILGAVVNDKGSEPPVLAVAEDGSAVVPLLGGHHGANDLARKIAEELATIPAITTSGDVHYGVALDDPPSGYHLANPHHAKDFMAAVLSGKTIKLEGAAPWLSCSKLPIEDEGTLRISVTTKTIAGQSDHLVYHPESVVLGMGLERDAPSDEAVELAEKILNAASIAPQSLAALVSIDLKTDERALHAVSHHFDVPAGFFSLEELKQQEDRLITPSKVVKAEVGVAGVAEGAALAAVGIGGEIISPKQKSTRVTAALAQALKPEDVNRATPRGRVFLVGFGPGSKAWRSSEAVTLLNKATDWVGYDLYLDLIQDLKGDQTEHRFPLGAEEERVRHAIVLAASGRDVAVVCSGDPGIYAMATLAYELIDTGAAQGVLPDAAKRVEVVVAPGISAFQAAAARAGAPIGHDFCCISLSDLLTPKEAIIKRLHAAAQGDFVTAFYNPRSKRRVSLLDEAFDILRQHRPADTPVILATDLGRPAENVRILSLQTVVSEEVDMLTLVMVGSSQSKAIKTGDGKRWVYTPRGYDRKEN